MESESPLLVNSAGPVSSRTLAGPVVSVAFVRQPTAIVRIIASIVNRYWSEVVNGTSAAPLGRQSKRARGVGRPSRPPAGRSTVGRPVGSSPTSNAGETKRGCSERGNSDRSMSEPRRYRSLNLRNRAPLEGFVLLIAAQPSWVGRIGRHAPWTRILGCLSSYYSGSHEG